MKKPKEPPKIQVCLFCDTEIEHILRVDERGKARMVAKCACS